MNKRLLFTLILVSFKMLAVAQDTIRTLPDPDIRFNIEDAIQDLDTDAQTDWTDLNDQMEAWLRKPMDLNKAGINELLQLPGMTLEAAAALVSYKDRFGDLTSVFELQGIPGFTPDLFENIKPFVTVLSVSQKDIKVNVLHPRGPTLDEILAGLKYDLTFRSVVDLRQEKGYTAADTNSDGSLTSRYLGSPNRYYTRIRAQYGQNVSICLTAEKDAGEEFGWLPKQKTYGFDFLSGHLFLRDFGKLKRLAIGDFNLQTGQGLIFSRGLGFGKGSETILAVKRSDLGILPYASVNENQFFRGAAATWGFGDVYVTGFFSRIGRDANIELSDTLNLDQLTVSTLQTSGLHRTESELEGKRGQLETSCGGRIEYRKPRLRVGGTYFSQQFSYSLALPSDVYRRFDFTGNANSLIGVDWDWTFRNMNWFGEVAYSRSGGIGGVSGLLIALDPKVDLSLYGRYFSNTFHSLRGFAFAESPLQPQSEAGLYSGIKLKPWKMWTISGYTDVFRFLWYRYQVDYPSEGYEYLGQVDYQPSKTLKVYFRYRYEEKSRNLSELPANVFLEQPTPYSKQTFRIHFEQKVQRSLILRTRLETSLYRQDTLNYTGFMIYQDIVCKLGFKASLSGRFAIYDIENYLARIYAYEHDVYGMFSVPAYNGRGFRFYAMLQFQPIKSMDIWIRYVMSRFPGLSVIGSGLTEVQGNVNDALHLQVRFTF